MSKLYVKEIVLEELLEYKLDRDKTFLLYILTILVGVLSTLVATILSNRLILDYVREYEDVFLEEEAGLVLMYIIYNYTIDLELGKSPLY